jgi:hypothetical protein
MNDNEPLTRFNSIACPLAPIASEDIELYAHQSS